MPLVVRSRRRLAWLSLNIVLNIIAASVIAMHTDTLEAVIALAVFLPIISDMSGCSGNQAVAVSMRELSLGVTRPSDLFRVLGKEIAVGVVNGIAWFLGASDPQAAATELLPWVDNRSDPDYFIFNYHRDAAAVAAGAQATVDYSSDLENWLPAVHNGSEVIIDDSGDPVQVRVRRSLAGEGRLFLRLNVAMPPAP